MSPPSSPMPNSPASGGRCSCSLGPRSWPRQGCHLYFHLCFLVLMRGAALLWRFCGALSWVVPVGCCHGRAKRPPLLTRAGRLLLTRRCCSCCECPAAAALTLPPLPTPPHPNAAAADPRRHVCPAGARRSDGGRRGAAAPRRPRQRRRRRPRRGGGGGGARVQRGARGAGGCGVGTGWVQVGIQEEGPSEVPRVQAGCGVGEGGCRWDADGLPSSLVVTS